MTTPAGTGTSTPSFTITAQLALSPVSPLAGGTPPQFTERTGRWLPITAGEIEMRRIVAIPVTWYRYRGTKIPNPWTLTAAAWRQESWRARWPERRTSSVRREPVTRRSYPI